jgi:divalent metal cation (Fe/Co/Zn/Cd) transporter
MFQKVTNASFWRDPNGHHAFILSVISLIITVIAAVGGLIGANRMDNSLLLVYGLENCVDFFSSAIVLWRFYLPSSSDAADEARLLGREKRASIAISMVLAILGFGTILTSTEDFISGEGRIEDADVLNMFAWINILSIAVFGGLAVIKFHYADKLGSSSLKKDGLCSFIGAVLSLSMFINTMLMKADGAMWWLNPLIAMCCGVSALIYGFHGIYRSYVVDGIPICSPRWWLAGTVSTPNSNTMSHSQDLEMNNVSHSSPGHHIGGIPGSFDEDQVDEVSLT